jgi:hypothetical protein
MYPGRADPDLGVFVAGIAAEIERAGHRVERAVVDRRGGSRLKHLGLVARALLGALRTRPDVVYAHFLFPERRASWRCRATSLATWRPGCPSSTGASR